MSCPHRTQHGFSIPELLVAMGLSTVLLSTLIPLYRHWHIHLKNLQNRMTIIRQGVTVTGYLLEATQDFGLSPQYNGALLCLKPVRQQTPRGERYTWFEPRQDVLGYLLESVNGEMKRIMIKPVETMKKRIRVLLWDRQSGSCAIVQGRWIGSFLTEAEYDRLHGAPIHPGAFVFEVRTHRYGLKKERFYRVVRQHAVPFFGKEIRCRQQTPGVMCQPAMDRPRSRSNERWFIALPRWFPGKGNRTGE